VNGEQNERRRGRIKGREGRRDPSSGYSLDSGYKTASAHVYTPCVVLAYFYLLHWYALLHVCPELILLQQLTARSDGSVEPCGLLAARNYQRRRLPKTVSVVSSIIRLRTVPKMVT